jgi:CheY-like chemotaxis protein
MSRPERSILVVDDEPTLRLLIVRLLRGEGYAVEPAANGIEALDAVRRQRPDAVVLDLVMPKMDGWEFLRVCRATPELLDLPVIVMSATPTLRQPLERFNIVACLTKPFDLDALLSTLDTLWTRAAVCSVCGADARVAQELSVFATDSRAAQVWRLCLICLDFLQRGFDALRPWHDLELYLARSAFHLTEAELRGYVAAGLSSTRRGQPG